MALRSKPPGKDVAISMIADKQIDEHNWEIKNEDFWVQFERFCSVQEVKNSVKKLSR